MLPSPTVVFTIPSVHDDTVLDCRVYHPLHLNPSTVSRVSAPWEKKAAIIAHPYAPLGGCYDDPVVGIVASTILKKGFLVGTFNFRGAGSSKGVTSWSSKPEQGDYISMIGFMRYYMHYLSPPIPSNLSFDQPPSARVDSSNYEAIQAHPSETSPTSNSSVSATATPSKPLLILAGYSYGGLITTCLPPVSSPSILPTFSTPQFGSAQAEIRLRAQTLAKQQNEILHIRFEALLSQPPTSSLHRREHSLIKIDDNEPVPKANMYVRMGGEEDLRRTSHESHRPRSSFTMETPERLRKSVDRVRSLGKASGLSPQREDSHGSIASSMKSKVSSSNLSLSLGNGSSKPGTAESTLEARNNVLEDIPGIAQVETAYLLISPPKGLVGNLATMWSSSRAMRYAKGHEGELITEEDLKFVKNPTLTAFCHDDSLISVGKLRSWCDRLEKAREEGESRFRFVETDSGGHFWHDHDALRILTREVEVFVSGL